MNPKVVFDRLFTKGSSSLTQATVADRDFYRKSMLDYVLDDARTVRAKGPTREHTIRLWIVPAK